MLFFILRVALALAVAIGAGALSAHYAVEGAGALGSRRVGSWYVYPHRGTEAANPYAKARQARDGTLPLGISEGIELYADKDGFGRPLYRECSYRISGHFPAARYWTLYWLNDAGSVSADGATGVSAFHSRQILRNADGGFTLNIGPSPVPGNWMATAGSGRMSLVLALYDTPLSNDVESAELVLPAMTRENCGA